MKKIFLLIIMMLSFLLLIGCKGNIDNPSGGDNPEGGSTEGEHECIESEWIDVVEFTCGQIGDQYTECIICGDFMQSRRYMKRHEYSEEVIKEVTCTENGETRRYCIHCGNEQLLKDYAKGHEVGSVAIVKYPSATENGIKEIRCSKCKEAIRSIEFVNNAYTYNGKLSVKGSDLVNKSGRKVQLYGLSTHGMNWFGKYANIDTIASLVEGFGINVIRFSMTTSEGGYCNGTEATKKQMLADLEEGIAAATKLGIYVIVDWHMVGASEAADKNPLTYLEQSKEFFGYISEKYKKNDNILYEIMNEPNGSTSWSDCKKYANEIIPIIRKNSDGIILVGNPNWTSDLKSVMRDPLTGYENIMYTYHFYAGDHKQTAQVETAYDSGFPVFISEYGFMNSDGDGAIDDASGQNWKKVLDERNISYVAWNISNSECSSSIFKKGSNDIVDVSDENLREWGVYLKNWYRSKSGLDKLKDE